MCGEGDCGSAGVDDRRSFHHREHEQQRQQPQPAAPRAGRRVAAEAARTEAGRPRHGPAEALLQNPVRRVRHCQTRRRAAPAAARRRAAADRGAADRGAALGGISGASNRAILGGRNRGGPAPGGAGPTTPGPAPPTAPHRSPRPGGVPTRPPAPLGRPEAGRRPRRRLLSARLPLKNGSGRRNGRPPAPAGQGGGAGGRFGRWGAPGGHPGPGGGARPSGASVSGPARGCAGRDFGRFTCLKLRGIVLAPPMAAPPITRWQARHTPGPRARRAPPYPLTFFWRETAVQRPHQCRTRAFMPKLRSISAPFRAHFA